MPGFEYLNNLQIALEELELHVEIFNNMLADEQLAMKSDIKQSIKKLKERLNKQEETQLLAMISDIGQATKNLKSNLKNKQ